mmetsp:Transcript_8769/g.30941  ORF Transcript_8769/g.30941 Transcript_8769/m.30941 type:complete len:285 (-) Transcript_8769:92-946(-)
MSLFAKAVRLAPLTSPLSRRFCDAPPAGPCGGGASGGPAPRAGPKVANKAAAFASAVTRANSPMRSGKPCWPTPIRSAYFESPSGGRTFFQSISASWLTFAGVSTSRMSTMSRPSTMVRNCRSCSGARPSLTSPATCKPLCVSSTPPHLAWRTRFSFLNSAARPWSSPKLIGAPRRASAAFARDTFGGAKCRPARSSTRTCLSSSKSSPSSSSSTLNGAAAEPGSCCCERTLVTAASNCGAAALRCAAGDRSSASRPAVCDFELERSWLRAVPGTTAPATACSP